MEWWYNDGKGQFPDILKVAKKYLCVQGSSDPSEQCFSKAGTIVSEKSLTGENVRMFVFLTAHL